MQQLILVTAVIITLLTGFTHADVVVDPNHIGATDVTNEFGTPIDPTTKISTHNLIIGNTAAGELLIDSATNVNMLTSVTNADGVLGNTSGSTGTATVSGTQTTWTSIGNLFVGLDGTGTLNIDNGGTVSNFQSTIGNHAGSEGTTTVKGATSTWTNNGNLFIGVDGTGTLNIEDGGAVAVKHADGFIGFRAGSTGTATVTGTNSTWTDTDDLRVGGFSGTGTLNIEDGGNVDSRNGFIGADTRSHGTAIVTGSGSTWINRNVLFVGGSSTAPDPSTGELNVRDGGEISVANTLKIWGTGTVNLLDGNINTKFFEVVAGGTFSHTGGTLTVTDGTLSDGNVDTYVIDGADNPTVDLNNASLNLGTRHIRVGDKDQGTLNIRNGGAVSNHIGFIGTQAGSMGAATITGTGSTWTQNSEFTVGLSGVGVLKIEDGGTVRNTFGSIGWNPGSMGTVEVSGAHSSWFSSAALTVGGSGIGMLNISDGAYVSSGEGIAGGFNAGIIANLAGSKGIATIAGTGSIWNNSGNLNVGVSGIGILNIKDSGTVSNDFGDIGTNAGAEGTVTVSGVDSTWNNKFTLFVGRFGTGTLNIENGGRVSSSSARLGTFGADSTGTVTISGADSNWTNSAAYTIGGDGTGMLTIEDGGILNNNFGRIGSQAGSTGTATVTGADSFWSNNGGLTVGQHGAGTLNIENGGGVSSHNDSYIGLSGGSVGTATVTGKGSTWTNGANLAIGGSTITSGGTGTLNVSDGGAVTATKLKVWDKGIVNFSGGTIETNSLDVVKNGTFAHSGGTLIIKDGTLSDANNEIYTIDGTNNPTVVLDNALFDLGSGILAIGGTDQGTLKIENGGTVRNDEGFIGITTLGTVSVTGSNSTWENGNNLTVGDGGAGILNIKDGGSVSSNAGIIGFTSSAKGTVTVTNAHSIWKNNGNLYVGFAGTGILNIQDGATVTNDHGSIGHFSGSRGIVTVTGAGSKWANDGVLIVGEQGEGTLEIKNQGTVSSLSGFIGNVQGPGDVTVDGTGSRWDIDGALRVGHASGNTGTVTITQGGAVEVTSDSSVLSVRIDSDNNAAVPSTVTVDGAESKLTMADHRMAVGVSGTGVLDIKNGGAISSLDGLIASFEDASGTVRVEGTESKWTMTETLVVGSSGAGTLDIQNGGKVSNHRGHIGFGADSIGTVSVEGNGSQWINNSSLTVGTHGSGTLHIQDGGTVSNKSGYIGREVGSTGAVTVSGANSTWTNESLQVGGLYTVSGGTGTLKIQNDGTVTVADTLKVWETGTVNLSDGTVETQSLDVAAGGTLTHTGGTLTVKDGTVTDGNSGNFVIDGVDHPTVVLNNASLDLNDRIIIVGELEQGTLNIINGGNVSNDVGVIGSNAGSAGSVTVTGTDSTWTNSHALGIGNEGTGTLNIENGGTVNSNQGFIGHLTGSTGTTTVTGAGSTWNNSRSLFVGNGGNGTLNIEDGGTVNTNADINTLGFTSDSTGTATITGTDSTWTNSDDLTVGRHGNGTLNIKAGGAVSNLSGFIGRDPGSTGSATVTGTDSTWTNSANLIVGLGGTGTLNIQEGGTVHTNATTLLGFEPDSIGTATVTGANSTWTNDANFYVGGSNTAAGGTGTLNVNIGGTVTVADTLKVWDTGTVNLNGGTLRFGELNLAPNANFNFNFGTVALNGDLMFDATSAVASVIPNHTLTIGKHLQVDGQLTLLTPVKIGDGQLSAGSILNPALLDFESGTLGLTQADLNVSSTGLFGDTLSLHASQTINVTHAVNVATDGRIELNGGHLNANTLNNHAVIQGHGRIGASLNNTATGQIRANSTDAILFTGTGNLNHGNINLSGGTVEFTHKLLNSSTGAINGRGVLIVSEGLNHQGQMNLSGGFTDVYGDVKVTEDASIVVSGGATATFFDDVNHNGQEIRTGTNSITTFFGTVSGAGSFTGSGSVYFEGIFSPGNSPDLVVIEGDANFGSSNLLVMELGGTRSGVDHDKVITMEYLMAGGTLDIRFINSFTPDIGDTFDLLDFDSAMGSFANILLPTLTGGKSFDTSLLLTTGVISVVPEPTTALLVSIFSLVGLRCRRSS